MAESIEHLLCNAEERIRIQSTGKTWVEEKFSASCMSREFEELFLKVLKY